MAKRKIDRRIIKFAVAEGRINDVSRLDLWGVGSVMSYQGELMIDKVYFALERSGLNSFPEDHWLVRKLGRERNRRREERGLKDKVTDAQRRAAYGGLLPGKSIAIEERNRKSTNSSETRQIHYQISSYTRDFNSILYEIMEAQGVKLTDKEKSLLKMDL